MPRRRTYQISWTMTMMSHKKTWRLHKPSCIFLSPQMMQTLKWKRRIKPRVFNPSLAAPGYDINLVRPSDDTVPGAISLVTAWEDGMLDKDTPQMKTPRMGRPGQMKTLDLLSPRRNEPQTSYHQEEMNPWDPYPPMEFC